MPLTTPVKNARTLVASFSNAAGSTQRGVIDIRTAAGGFLTVKMTNVATGPTLPCQCNILVAHANGATPAAASAGADWKTIQTFSGSVAANGVVERSFVVDPGIMHLGTEFTGNTGQPVTVEAFFSEITNYDTV